MIFNHIFLQSLDVGGTAICIDIQTVRRVVDDVCLRAQCVEYVFRNRGSASVCTVQTYPHIFERPGCQGNQITDIAVASRRIVNGASDRIALGKWNLAHLAIQIRLNLLDRLLLQFLTASVDDLDSVVIVWIVARGDHDTAVKLLGSYNIRYTRSGCHMKQIDICARSSQSRYQRILKHIAAASRILSDHNPAAICFRLLSIVPAQETTYFIGVLHGQRHICLAAESVCSKIFTHFESSSYIIKYRVQRSCTFMEIPTNIHDLLRFCFQPEENPAANGASHFLPLLLSMSDCTFFTEFLSNSDLPHPARTEGAQIRCPKVFLC